MTTADFAEWFTEAMTGPAVDVDVDGDGLGPIQSYEPGSRRYHDEAPEGRREGERAGEGEWSEERPSEQQGGAASCPSRRVSVGKRDDDGSNGSNGSNGSQPGQESQADCQPQSQPDCQPQSQPKPRLDPGAIDDAHLIRLVPEQEMNVAFPVGCPVWLNFRIDNYVRHDHGVNEGYDATHGVVRAIFLHSVMQNVVYKVELRHGDDDPAATSLCAFYEDQLAFAAKCPVYLELHDDLPKRTVEGEIVVPRWNWRDWRLDLDKSERNRNVSRVTYTALYSLDGTRVRVQDGLDAKQITFRRPVSLSIFHVDHDPAAIASLPVVQDTSQLYSAALPPHPSIHSEIPSASDYSSHPPHGESAQDTDLGNEYLLALADDQIKFSPPHSYSTAESPHPMGMEAEPAYGAVDATANEETAVHHYGGNGSENTSRFNHDADDNNNTIHLPALAPPPQPQSQSQPQPQLQPQPQIQLHRLHQHPKPYLPAPTAANALTPVTTPTSATGKLVESGAENTGRWTKKEHQLFLAGLELYGKQWKKVAEHVETRTTIQVRTHAQKYFKKLQKDREGQGPTGVPGTNGMNGMRNGNPLHPGHGHLHKGAVPAGRTNGVIVRGAVYGQGHGHDPGRGIILGQVHGAPPPGAGPGRLHGFGIEQATVADGSHPAVVAAPTAVAPSASGASTANTTTAAAAASTTIGSDGNSPTFSENRHQNNHNSNNGDGDSQSNTQWNVTPSSTSTDTVTTPSSPKKRPLESISTTITTGTTAPYSYKAHVTSVTNHTPYPW